MTGFRVNIVIAGVLLSTASGLKAVALATAPPDAIMGRTAASLAIAAELTLAVALLLGWWPLLLRRVGICCFALFAIVSAYKLIIGERSCGCFGSLHVPPAVTFALDCVMVAAFAVCRPPAEERKPISMRKAL